MKRYIKSTKYTVEYDDERISEASDLLDKFIHSISYTKAFTEYDWGMERVVKSKLINAINEYFIENSNGSDNFSIDIYGDVKHAHNIGNNNEYSLLIVGLNSQIICGYAHVNTGMYGEAYIYIEDLSHNRVGNTYEVRDNYVKVNDKYIKRFR